MNSSRAAVLLCWLSIAANAQDVTAIQHVTIIDGSDNEDQRVIIRGVRKLASEDIQIYRDSTARSSSTGSRARVDQAVAAIEIH